MMHKWESTDKLLSEWETQEVKDGLVYDNFTFQRDEFDNVPPVVPRFLFYLQLNLQPAIAKLKELCSAQSTVELKNEMLKMFDDQQNLIDSKET